MKIICESTRLYFREFEDTKADAANVFNMNSKPAVLEYLHERALTSIEDASVILREHIFPQYSKKLGRWSVHLKINDTFIGWCGLKQRAERNNEIDLGYRFLPEYWGQGFASEAAFTCLDHGFQKLELDEITACAHIENLASLRILEKIGMQFSREDIIDECPVRCFTATKSSRRKG